MPAGDPRYPIGPFAPSPPTDAAERGRLIQVIADCPDRLASAVRGLDESQLDTPYRAGGWMLRQVAHHLPDSHMNAYMRFKLALTEDAPTIKPYAEDRLARLADYGRTPLEVSVTLLTALHARWVVLLESMDDRAWERTFAHPETGIQTLAQALDLYAWHSRHHVAHITSARARHGW